MALFDMKKGSTEAEPNASAPAVRSGRRSSPATGMTGRTFSIALIVAHLLGICQ